MESVRFEESIHFVGPVDLDVGDILLGEGDVVVLVGVVCHVGIVDYSA